MARALVSHSIVLALALSGCGLQSDMTRARSDLDAVETDLDGLAGQVNELSDQVGEDMDDGSTLEQEIAELRRQLLLTQDLIGDGANIEGNIVEHIDGLRAQLSEQEAEIAALQERLEARIAAVETDKADLSAVTALTSRVETNEGILAPLSDADLPARMTAVEASTSDNTAQIAANRASIGDNAATLAGARSDLATLRADHDALDDALASFEADVGGMFEVWGPHYGGKTDGSLIFDGTVIRSPYFATAKLLKACDYSYLEVDFEGNEVTQPDLGIEVYSGTKITGLPMATLLLETESSVPRHDGHTRQRVWVASGTTRDLFLAPIPRSSGYPLTISHIGCINLP